MPWKPSYSEAEARRALENANTWAGALRALGLAAHGKNANTLRKWASRWGIAVDHLPVGGRAARMRVRFSEDEARAAISASRSWSEALRRLGYCPSGGNPATLKNRAATWGIPTDHFDPYAAARDSRQRKPLSEILVEGSSYSRHHLKRRLFSEGLKQRACELCGQGEDWNGRKMSLILDHANGVRDDNRIGNLRVVCPNCAATLETHCSRNPNGVHVRTLEPRACLRCGSEFAPRYADHRYCSAYCGTRRDRTGVKRPGARKVERPSHRQLLEEIEEHGYLGVGRRYGVSDNAVRKWIRDYEREDAIARGDDPSVVQIPTRTWPNRRRAA